MKGWEGKIEAALVWDGSTEVHVPDAMGKPRDDQMQGTWSERLVEVAGRACYDSMGTGRDSVSYHKHLLDVAHLSVHEHPHWTVGLSFESAIERRTAIVALANWPSVWVCIQPNRVCGWTPDDPEPRFCLRVTLNGRHLLEAQGHLARSVGIGMCSKHFADAFGLLCSTILHRQAPVWSAQLAEDFPAAGVWDERTIRWGDPHGGRAHSFFWKLEEPSHPCEEWITLRLTGSRIFSHELVRHGDWTAISQRSGRFCDESYSEWVMHPMSRAFFDAFDSDNAAAEPRDSAIACKAHFLGNALQTEVVFSASVAQWRHMLRMRASDAADAEIRQSFAETVLAELRKSRYAHRFSDMDTVPSSDGLGRSLKGGGAA